MNIENEYEKSFNDSIANSRLVVSTYNATTFLETMALNIPTVIFWNPKHWELRDEAIDDFEDLKRVGILYHSPEACAKHVSAIWSDVSSWWRAMLFKALEQNFAINTHIFIQKVWTGWLIHFHLMINLAI